MPVDAHATQYPTKQRPYATKSGVYTTSILAILTVAECHVLRVPFIATASTRWLHSSFP